MDTGIRKLPVWATATASYGAVLGHLMELVRLAMWPMALFYGFFIALYSYFGRELVQPVTLAALYMLLGMVMVPFVVAWHRLVLLGPEAVAGSHGLTFGRREARFFVSAFVVSLLGGLVIGLGGGLSAAILVLVFKGIPTRDIGVEGIAMIGALAVLIGVPALAWAYRLLLVLPSVAVDAGGSLRKALRLTRGNAFRFLTVVVLVFLPAAILFLAAQAGLAVLLAAVLGPDLGLAVAIPVARLVDLLQYFVTGALGASALSLSYRLLALWRERNDALATFDTGAGGGAG